MATLVEILKNGLDATIQGAISAQFPERSEPAGASDAEASPSNIDSAVGGAAAVIPAITINKTLLIGSVALLAVALILRGR